MSDYIKTNNVRTLGQKIRKYVFDKIYFKFGEYNHDKDKWEFKPLKIFRIKLHKSKKAYIGYDFVNYQWCPYNLFKITGSSTERFHRGGDHWIRTYYKEKYLWQLKFKVVREEEENEDELLEDMRVEFANQCAGYGVL